MAAQQGTRLFKIASQLNIGKETIVEFLQSKGFPIDAKPTSVLTEEMTDLVLGKFQKEYKAAEKHRERLEQHRPTRPTETEIPAIETQYPIENATATITEEPILQTKTQTEYEKNGDTPVAENPAETTAIVEEPVQTISKIEETTAIVEEPVQTISKIEETTAIVEEPVQTISKIEETTSKTEETVSKAEEAASKTEETVSKAEEAASKTEETAGISATKQTADIEQSIESETESSESGKKKKKRKRMFEIEYEAGSMPQLPGLTIVGKIDLRKKPQPTVSRDSDRNRDRGRDRERPRHGGGATGGQRPDPDAALRVKQALSTSPVEGERGNTARPNVLKTSHNKPAKHIGVPAVGGAPKVGGDAKLNEKKKKRKKSIREQISEEEVDRVIRETLQGMDEASSVGFRSKMRQKKKAEREEKEQRRLEEMERDSTILKLTEFVTTGELANMMSVGAGEIIMKCMKLGLMVSINQRLDKDTITLIADDYGYQIEFVDEQSTETLDEEVDDEATLRHRPPIVTIMGHVDHGKTSLLDYIRKANVVAGEAGGITQHIGAYRVELPSGKFVSFLDTPGHEAFTAMRARGAKVTDIVILVVAADDNVMPQTIEAISHAQAAGVPIIVAINKIDRPDAHPDTIRQQLANRGLLVEEWGGNAQCVEVSAKSGKNVDVLLEKVLLEAEILDLKANPDRDARGTIIEAHLDKGKGILATVMTQKGTLKIGDAFIAGLYSGRVRAMYDERGNRVEKAGPSTPVQVSGFDGLPQAGDLFTVTESDAQARSIANQRQQLAREQQFRQTRHKTLDEISQQIQQGGIKDLRLIIKGDVGGSVEALGDSLLKLSHEEVRVNILHTGVGAISETDVMLASASDAVIIGFNVQPTTAARKSAEHEAIDIRLYSIIYDCINEIQLALEGLLSPEIKEEITGVIEVRQTFRISKTGVIAGCYVQSGKIIRNDRIRVLRDGFQVYKGTIHSLKRIKDDVREVDAGYECGILLNNFNDIEVGDIIEAVKTVEIKRKLS